MIIEEQGIIPNLNTKSKIPDFESPDFEQVGDFGDITVPELLKINKWIVIIAVEGLILALLLWLESLGL